MPSRLPSTPLLLLLLLPALFSLLLIFQGTEYDFRIRLTPTGRLACTTDAGCALKRTQNLSFLIVGDIGGLPVYPYYSYAQTKVARALAKAARRQPPNFVLNVGDNFYFNGVSDIFDTRFEASFEEIYDYPELLVPWYTIAGNHDHLGNISAQLAHTNFSNKWTMPDLFYKVRIAFDFPASSSNESAIQNKQQQRPADAEQQLQLDQEQEVQPDQQPVVLDLLMLDTIVLCGNTVDMDGQSSMFSWLFSKKKDPDGPDPEYRELAKQQWAWIERKLNESDADYLLVAGHYPIYSTCEHGGFACLQRLDRLLHANGANAYFSGHDHNLQHIHQKPLKASANDGSSAAAADGDEGSADGVDYLVCGASSRSDRSAKHLDDVSAEALRFRYPIDWNPISQIGFSNGGFIQARLARDKGKFDFYNGKNELKYSFEMRPRRRPRTTTDGDNNENNNKM